MTSTLLIKSDSEYFKKYSTDSGLDIPCLTDLTIEPGTKVKINLGIRCEMISKNGKPEPFYLYPRSSICKKSLILANSVGIIDSSYRGPIYAVFWNIGTVPEVIEAGEKLIQICSKNLKPFNIKLVDELSSTSRGDDGFGSTNKN